MIVTIDKVPYEDRHLMCFDCEYCYISAPYHKECSRKEQKIEYDHDLHKGYCYNRVENED